MRACRSGAKVVTDWWRISSISKFCEQKIWRTILSFRKRKRREKKFRNGNPLEWSKTKMRTLGSQPTNHPLRPRLKYERNKNEERKKPLTLWREANPRCQKPARVRLHAHQQTMPYNLQYVLVGFAIFQPLLRIKYASAPNWTLNIKIVIPIIRLFIMRSFPHVDAFLLLVYHMTWILAFSSV